MALAIQYDGNDYTLELEDMDTDQARAMERFGVPNLRALEEGIEAGDLASLTVAFWVMLQQSGEPGARIDRIKFKPLKFIKAIAAAAQAAKAAEDDDPKED